MKKRTINIISLLIVLCVVFSLVSCGGKKDDTDTTETTSYQTKASTSQAVEIIDIPTQEKEIVDMFNAALDFVDVYGYNYTKKIRCTVSSLNIGSLSSASNANDALKSIFGEIDSTTDYNYDTSKDIFETNFPKGRVDEKGISSASAKQDGDFIVVTVNIPSENNPTAESGQLNKFSNEYLSVDSVNANLKEFASSATSVSIAVSDIVLTAKINSSDSSLDTLTVSYKEQYNLSGVKLVQLDSGAVSGTGSFVVTYSGFLQN